MQAKILRALQERTVTPVGGRPVRIDVRVLAATHRDLETAARDRAFREDLFYRLNVVPIHLAPLRERQADIIPLAEHFLFRATEPHKQLSADAAARLMAYAWPGNVRELRNAIERVAISAATISSRHPILRSSPLYRPRAIRPEPSIGRRATCRVPSPAWRCA
jgi:transcriptional regulator with GAF, ATPase, and Fis domain